MPGRTSCEHLVIRADQDIDRVAILGFARPLVDRRGKTRGTIRAEHFHESLAVHRHRALDIAFEQMAKRPQTDRSDHGEREQKPDSVDQKQALQVGGRSQSHGVDPGLAAQTDQIARAAHRMQQGNTTIAINLLTQA